MQSDSKEAAPGKPKCRDCTMCQLCSEVRCRSCRGGKLGKAKKKLSIEEQIALFNSLNPELAAGGCGKHGCCRKENEK